MTRRLRGAVAGLAVFCVLGMWAGQGRSGDKGAWKEFLPEDAYKDLVEREAKVIKEALKGDDEDQLKRARVGALMIMGYAVSHKKNAGTEVHFALAQDLGRTIRAKGKLDDARKLADKLARGGEGHKTTDAATDFREGLDLYDIMNPLKVQKKGGDGIASELQVNIPLKGGLNGIEEKFRSLARKKLSEPVLDRASKELSLLSYRMAVLAELTHDYPAPKKKGTPKEWKELSVDMRDAAIELATAARKKDAEAVHKATNRLNSSCSQCHSLFR